MINTMIKKNQACHWGHVIFLVLTICISLSGYGQSIQDLSSINVDELSDEQLRTLVRRAEEAGLSEGELIQMAQVRGVPQEEIDKLRERLQGMDLEIGSSGSADKPSKRKPRRQFDVNEITRGMIDPEQGEMNKDDTDKYFGMSMFYSKNRRLTFEPNLNMATPRNYVIGPGDMLYIDVYGQSEKYFEVFVTPEGNVLLDNIGPITVSGLTINEAAEMLKARLSRFYTGLTGSNPNTFLQLSLGNIRTIQVHLVGEVRLPGTFTLSAFSTAFNALYAAGGPNEDGTMRNVKLIRNNKEIARIDVYDFLMNGRANMEKQLQDQDIILVEPFEGRVSFKGEVKRPMIFEVKAEETLADVLKYAGGFTDEAFRERVSVARVTDKERAVSDVFKDQFSFFMVKGGDSYEVGKVLDRYTNRVQIKGAVFREGNYSLSEGMTLTQLIERAEGLRGEAFTKRVTILRTKKDLSPEMKQYDLSAIMQGNQPDIVLQAEDIIRVPSIYDLSEDFYVKIAGEVREPGIYPYAQEMTVEDLIMQAGGLKEAASRTDIEIARRSSANNARDYSEIIPVSVAQDLSLNPNPVRLQPFDNVAVRRKTNFTLEKTVQIEGQVKSPGVFSIRHAEERISDIIRRSGGTTEFAYSKGATLIRRTEFYQADSEKIQKQRNLKNLIDRLNLDFGDPTESQALLLARLAKAMVEREDELSRDAEEAIIEAREGLLGDIAESRVGISPVKIKETEAIAIDLETILNHPGSRFDLILEEGDIISIPRQLQTVRLRGDVIYPTTVRHENFRSMSYYINRAGGFDNRAKRRRTYVVYANGEVARTKNFLLFNVYPKVEPGAEIIVPTKGPRIPIRPGELVGLTTGLATIALLMTQILN
ncbi:SLBB domain-containing protein [Pleomorphovibrio marinus]|uniref:SLBB domain-containing protein n=1 Tax=Pleomorphovibrio marinus TaxID=2164132 RepID=UPI001E598822|nr:SLBB domain-containing protein [Pleomorphovibrio marinus]